MIFNSNSHRKLKQSSTTLIGAVLFLLFIPTVFGTNLNDSSHCIELTQADLFIWNESENAWSSTTDEISKIHAYHQGMWHNWNTPINKFRYELAISVCDDVSSEILKQRSYHILANIPGAYSVTIDDNLIAYNGTIQIVNGVPVELSPGENRLIIPLPNQYLTEGDHQIVILGARNDTGFTAIKHSGIHVKSLSYILSEERWHIISYGSYVLYFIAALYFLTNFFSRREHISHLYLGLICFAFSAYALNKLAYYHLDLNYRQAGYVLYAVYSFNYVIGVLAHLLVFEILKLPRKVAAGALVAPLFIILIYARFDSFLFLKTNFAWLTAIGILGIFLRKQHAFKVAFILSAVWAAYNMQVFDRQQFVLYGALFAYLLFSIGLAGLKQHKEKQEATLKNTRLDLELVKSKIQPHFILNSITSAMEWIESDPKQGVRFLSALAREFESLSKMTSHKEIPLKVEIDSCKNYLEVMEFRKKANYELVLTNVDLALNIPPSIIRNLLENAITHNYFGKESIVFELKQSLTDNKSWTTLVFESPYSRPKRLNTRNQEQEYTAAKETDLKSMEKPDGTGVKYIKARLMESYKNKWYFSHGPVDHKWVTTIKIPPQNTN